MPGWQFWQTVLISFIWVAAMLAARKERLQLSATYSQSRCSVASDIVRRESSACEAGRGVHLWSCFATDAVPLDNGLHLLH